MARTIIASPLATPEEKRPVIERSLGLLMEGAWHGDAEENGRLAGTIIASPLATDGEKARAMEAYAELIEEGWDDPDDSYSLARDAIERYIELIRARGVVPQISTVLTRIIENPSVDRNLLRYHNLISNDLSANRLAWLTTVSRAVMRRLAIAQVGAGAGAGGRASKRLR